MTKRELLFGGYTFEQEMEWKKLREELTQKNKGDYDN